MIRIKQKVFHVLTNYLFLIISVASTNCYGQNISICSWNLKDFGKSKNDKEIYFIANTIRKFDIIAIQEVVSGPGGSQAVARLADRLNRMGSKWDYVVSNPTSGASNASERYAFLWKVGKVKKRGDAWLSPDYALEIDREPFFCRFKVNNMTFTLVNFHSVPKARHPESEIKYFKFFPALYPEENLIFCGDFNLPQSHSVFNPLKKIGYTSVLVNRKTTLRQKCIKQECLASEFDHIFYSHSRVKVVKKGFVEFFRRFPNLKAARMISDHIPIFAELR